ncbi:MAG: hypothetical protein ACOCG5_03555, partial [Candidatus Alkaliphilus sp. MAG34]
MSVGIIDAVEWQTVVDFKTGGKSDAESEKIDIARRILENHHYPGDLDLEGIDWTVKMALELDKEYKPELMFVMFGTPFFHSVYRQTPEDRWKTIVDYVFDRTKYFLDVTEYEPIIIGLGDMVDIKGYIELNNLDGLYLANNWSYRCSGILEHVEKDLDKIEKMEGISTTISKADFIDKYKPNSDFAERLPDYLLAADEGYQFKGYGSSARKAYKIPALNEHIPVYTKLGEVKDITDIRKVMDKALQHKKVAVIIIEGVGLKDFRYPYEPCNNRVDWYTYDQSENHYLTISTGKHYYQHEIPPVSRYLRKDFDKIIYPFSGPHHYLPQDTAGRKPEIKSAAVSNRGMFPHVVSGADICIESFARNLYNMGSIAIINDDK